MPESPAEIKLVSNAMSNATRRNIMNLLSENARSKEDIGRALGQAMLDYHLQILQRAGLINIREEMLELTHFGKNLLESKAEKSTEIKKDLSGTKPIEVVEVKQLLPCIADKSKYRVIARLEPPLGGALKVLEPLFPRARYSENLGILIIQRGNILITAYSTGNITMTMITGNDEAEQILEDFKEIINEAIEKGITPVAREKVNVDHAHIYEYLPKTNCRICGEQSCYSFAIRLVGKETTLDKCTPLREQKYAVNLEHLRALMEYL
jgi:ArsR family metal-binding transcriptional regulator